MYIVHKILRFSHRLCGMYQILRNFLVKIAFFTKFYSHFLFLFVKTSSFFVQIMVILYSSCPAQTDTSARGALLL